MKKYFSVIFGVTVFLGTGLCTEAPDTAWTRIFKEMKIGYSIQQTQDGGYIVTGYGSSMGIPLLKTDSLGNKEWYKTFLIADGGDYGQCVQETQDGGYVVTGRVFQGSNGDIGLLKTDSLGNKEWGKNFGGVEEDVGNCVQQTTDGGYIISGETSPVSPPVRELWLIKLEPDAGTEEGKLNLPNEFLLSQNSSNPFSNSTEIKFGLPEDSNVNISVYNLVGEKVATLIDEPRNAGCYTTRWEATNNSGEKLATGVYFSKLSAKSQGKTYTKTLKICLMR